MAAKSSRVSGAIPQRDPSVHVRERGDIFFFYRPKVKHEVAKGLDDVQRLYVILSPRGKASYRLIVIPAKRLPATGRSGDRKTWGFVEKVSSNPEEVEDELDPKSYLTKTRGERHRPAARPAGEGVYTIVGHRGHTHLAYALELPKQPGDVQQALNIGEEAIYVVSVKNPKARGASEVGLEPARRARLPENLQKRFRGRRFIPLDPPDFLDHEGAEILFVGAKQSVIEELGLTLDREDETEATAEIFNDLRVERSVHPVEPLLKGQWA
jgi:hypothetical protein